MASEKEMTLMVYIKANASKLGIALKHAMADLERFKKNAETFGTGLKGAFSFLQSVGGILLAPLKWAAEAMMGLAAGVTAFGAAALTAAASDERLASRLGAVYGNAERGKRVFRELEMISIESPFKAEDLAEGLIVMNQYGLGSKRNLLALANGAKVAGVSVGELALQVSALQARGLKRFGIEFDTQGEGGVIKFKDRMGQMRKIVAATTDEARKKLMDVFVFKFGIKVNPTTLSGLISQFRNAIDVSMSTIGDTMLPAAKYFLKFISGGLVDALKSGKIEEWGKKFGDTFNKIVAKLLAAFDTAKAIWDSIAADVSGGRFHKALVLTMTAAGEIMAVVFVNYLKAMSVVFVGIGKLIASTFANELLQLPIPGLSDKARDMALDNVNTQPVPALRKRAVELGILTEKDSAKLNNAEVLRYLHDRIANRGLFGSGEKLTTDQQVGMATMNGPELMTKSFREFKGNLNGIRSETSGAVKEILTGLNRDIGPVVGFNVGEEFSKNKAKHLQNIENTGKVRVTEQFLGPWIHNNEMRYPYRKSVKPDETSIQMDGKYKRGETGPRGGTVIQIEELNVKASDSDQLTSQLIRHSQSMEMSAAYV
jgi:hypothetical protein